MKRNVLFLLASLIVAAEGHPIAADVLHVVASATGPASDPHIEFSITNVSGRPVGIASSTLPWTWRYAAKLEARRQDATRLKEITPIADPPPPALVLLPTNGCLTGRVALRDRFPTLLRELRTSEVTVHWAVEILGDEHALLSLAQGDLRLPRRKGTIRRACGSD